MALVGVNESLTHASMDNKRLTDMSTRMVKMDNAHNNLHISCTENTRIKTNGKLLSAKNMQHSIIFQLGRHNTMKAKVFYVP